MARKRRTYTPEFKAEAVKLVTEQGYSVAEAARSLGLGETLLRQVHAQAAELAHACAATTRLWGAGGPPQARGRRRGE